MCTSSLHVRRVGLWVNMFFFLTFKNIISIIDKHRKEKIEGYFGDLSQNFRLVWGRSRKKKQRREETMSRIA